MCIIIHKPDKQQLPNHIIENAIRINPHGMGHIDLKTGYLSRTQSKTKMRELLHKRSPFIAHCRLATLGGVNRQGIHPFYFETAGKHPNGLLFQNGTIGGFKDHRSDSANLAELLSMVKVKSIRPFLESFESRFLIYWDNGTVETYGEWIMQDGIAYSKPNVLRNTFTFGKLAV